MDMSAYPENEVNPLDNTAALASPKFATADEMLSWEDDQDYYY